ncbi:hypothetical protein MMC30_000734 [Trapelia coarctata]|nr:hypothetical protein [Trapelia coarctata]
MFARLRQFARGFLSQPDPIAQTVTADQQIQQELAEAASPGMVTTRSQEHNAGDNSLVEAPNTDTPNNHLRKRKVDDGGERTPSQSAVKKRRVSPKKESVAAADPAVPNGSPKEVATNKTSEEAQRFLDDIDISISNGKSPPEQDTPGSQAPVAKVQMPAAVNRSQDIKTDAVLGGNEEGSGSNNVQHQSNTSRKRKKTKPTHSGPNGELHTASTSFTKLTNRPKENRPEVKKPTHKRFGSEEPVIGSDQPFLQDAQTRSLDTAMKNADASEEGSDNGDDVPEVVTVSAGLNQVRSAAAEAAKAVEIQSLAKKEKRQKRDAHLKEQAATAKKHRKPHANERLSPGGEARLPNGNPDTDPEAHNTRPKPQTKQSFKRSGPLPALLPDAILAAEPVIRPPTPPAIVMAISSKKQRFTDTDPKPPKDIKKGPIKVRVLEDNKSALPPRASKVSKNLKESWLAGERGRKNVVSQRRKTGGGFLRN